VILTEQPNLSLQRCVNSVEAAIKNDERLASIKGIYVLVDEYDAFPNSYLAQLMTTEGRSLAWEETAVGRTFKSFWSTMKSLCTHSIIRRTFITGISPLSLSSIGSGFNITETCLAYVQCIIEGVKPQAEEPQNSEISEQFLNICAASPLVTTDLEKALENSTLEYDRFKHQFTLRDLVC